ncbi:MAG: hypothetical protein EOP37_25780 [Rubrivivax sp.]|nr:MAG: hypothetical protein EOP37_25780 [Rubrivivax sp.]
MKKLITKTVVILLATGLFITACKKEKKPNVVPTVNTSTISNPLATSAMGGGNITSDGGVEVTASGLVYSNINQTPTVSNDTALTSVSNGNFTSMLKNLTPSTTYYVRAYATNSIGTGYGEVVTFSTGNGGPVALNVVIAGKVEVGEVLSATYSYSDAENDAEEAAIFQWYRANDALGTGEVAITGATASTYKLLSVDEFKFIRVGITAKAKTGTTSGTQVKSPFTLAVAVEPTTVTFTYDGKQVTYGILTSSVTGRKWLDRNLGAAHVATDYNTDYLAKGDLFQWGRAADGHQLIKREPVGVVNTAVNGTTTTISTSPAPGHFNFILIDYIDNFDWLKPSNNNLWNSSNQENNPCPQGWHIPSKAEWEAENLSGDQLEAFDRLKLTNTGRRASSSGSISSTGGRGWYWTSTINATLSGVLENKGAYLIQFPATPLITDDLKSEGLGCRCIKN